MLHVCTLYKSPTNLLIVKAVHHILDTKQNYQSCDLDNFSCSQCGVAKKQLKKPQRNILSDSQLANFLTQPDTQ